MRAHLLIAAMGAALVTSPVLAQQPARTIKDAEVVVQGVRSHPSNWREAETAHVIMLSDGREAELIRLTRNLERLHFLLSGLLARTDAADDTVKIRITLIGEVPEFEAMGLKNRRWQQGPFNELFTLSRYYDPRDDGSVMATTRVDQSLVVERTPVNAQRIQSMLGGMFLGGSNPFAGAAASVDPAAGIAAQSSGGAAGAEALAQQVATLGTLATSGMRGAHDLPVTFGEKRMDVTAESQLYAGYAQHFLQTYFPAAYPRWYLDGFGQVFSSLVVKGDTVLEYGRSPRGTGAVLDSFGAFPLSDVLDETYLHTSTSKTGWTPIHAWMLTHFLLFADNRRPQLRQYLQGRAAGIDPASAAQVFGDQKQLARELRAYFGKRKPYEVVTYPAKLIEEPIVHRLSEGEAAFVKGRLELGARVTIPPVPHAGEDAKQVARLAADRAQAIRDRDRWLVRLRGDAARWPNELGAQLLLAEAECRSGNAAPCLAAAERAAVLAPQDGRALAWKGTAMVLAAAAAPEPERAERLRAARQVIAAANKANNDAVEPLLAYYASFVAAGQVPPVNAVDGLQRAVALVPNAPTSRLELATALANRGQLVTARQVVMPVAAGPYDTPEKPAATALVTRIAAAGAGAPGGHSP